MSQDFMHDGPGTPPPPLPPPGPGTGFVRPPKTPGAAVLLSLFPGLGQIYNGQPAKALVFFLAWAGCIAAVSEGEPMPFALMIPFIWLYNMVDAWRSACAINERAAGGAPVPERDAVESPAWGATLVALGLVLLARNLGYISIAMLARYWPVLLIAAGAALLVGSLQRRQGGGDAGL